MIIFHRMLHANWELYTHGEKVVTPPSEAIKSIWIGFLCFQWAEIDMKCTCDLSGWNPTFPWPNFHFSAKWDRQSPKPQLRWSFPQICLRTVASYNQQLRIFSQFPPTPLAVTGELSTSEGENAGRSPGEFDTVFRALLATSATLWPLVRHAFRLATLHESCLMHGIDSGILTT